MPGTSGRLSQTAGPAEPGRKTNSLYGDTTQVVSQNDIQDLGNLVIQEYKVKQSRSINHTYQYAYTVVKRRGVELKRFGFCGRINVSRPLCESLKMATINFFSSGSSHSSTHHWVGSLFSYASIRVGVDSLWPVERGKVMLCWFWVWPLRVWQLLLFFSKPALTPRDHPAMRKPDPATRRGQIEEQRSSRHVSENLNLPAQFS